MVCDLDRFVVRTHFTGTPTVAYRIGLDELGEPDNLRVLRAVLTDPGSLRPRQTTAKVTEAAAAWFATLAEGLRARTGWAWLLIDGGAQARTMHLIWR